MDSTSLPAKRWKPTSMHLAPTFLWMSHWHSLSGALCTEPRVPPPPGGDGRGRGWCSQLPCGQMSSTGTTNGADPALEGIPLIWVILLGEHRGSPSFPCDKNLGSLAELQMTGLRGIVRPLQSPCHGISTPREEDRRPLPPGAGPPAAPHPP